MNSIKICFIASTGGHFEQLMMLKPLIDKYDSFLVTERTDYSLNVGKRKVYYLRQVNRYEKTVIIKLILNRIRSLYIFIKEKPDMVISLGALATIPMCLLCKIFRKKLIFIESFAKVTSPTLTGKLLYKYADRFYIQWEEMEKIYPKAIYEGGIY